MLPNDVYISLIIVKKTDNMLSDPPDRSIGLPPPQVELDNFTGSSTDQNVVYLISYIQFRSRDVKLIGVEVYVHKSGTFTFMVSLSKWFNK